MSFGRPELLWLIPLALGIVAGGILGYARRRRRLADLFGGMGAARRLSGIDLYRFPVTTAVLLGAAAFAVSLAAAEPHYRGAGAVTSGEPWDVVLAVDISRSMQATDVPPTRLAGAREALFQLLEMLPSHRLGLLLFAGESYELSPLTTDGDVVRFYVDGIDPELVSENDEGTRLANALERGRELFERQPRPAGGRAVVLLTDGDLNEPDEEVTRAVRALASRGVRVFSIGIGTTQGTGLTRPHRPGRWGGPILNEDGSPVISRLNEPLLREIAKVGRGSYARAESPGDLSQLLGELARLPESGGGSRGSWLWKLDPVFWLAMAAIVFLLIESVGQMRAPRRPTLATKRHS